MGQYNRRTQKSELAVGCKEGDSWLCRTARVSNPAEGGWSNILKNTPAVSFFNQFIAFQPAQSCNVTLPACAGRSPIGPT
jgi:hypothetical protein